MKNYIHLYLLVLIFNFNYSQEKLQDLKGDWILVNTRMLDGSKDLSYLLNKGTSFEKFSFQSNVLCKNVLPVENYRDGCNSYKIKGNKIVINESFYYEVEKFSNDSLIVIERVKHINESNKITKKTFLNLKIIENERLEKFKDSKEIIADKYFSPILVKPLFKNVVSIEKNKNWPIYCFICQINIFPKQKRVELELLNMAESKTHLGYFEEEKKKVENSFNSWNLSIFKHFDKISIPIIIYSIKNDLGAKNYQFFAITKDELILKYGPSLDQIKNYGNNFNLAYNYFQKNDFPNAVKHFRAAYEANPTQVDPLYNIVNIYFHLNEINAACETLKTLVDLEQTEGIKLYNAHCLKN